VLQEGARKARATAKPLLAELRHAVGLRPMVAVATPGAKAAKAAAARLPEFKQYREADGRFYFKLSAADGRVLLQSQGFDGGREAGEWVKHLKSEGAGALAGAPVERGEGVSEAEVAEALSALVAAE